MNVSNLIAELLNSIATIIKATLPSASKIKLFLPLITKNGKIMNFELKCDTIATITITTVDVEGDIVAAPSGDVFSVSSSDATKLTAAIGTDASGHAAVVLTPLVRAATGLSITVSDTAKLTSDVQVIDIVADLTPSAIGLDLANATTVSQPVPAS